MITPFSNSVEKYNEKMSMWNKTWLVIDTLGLFFYDKRPITKNECSLYKEFFSFEKMTIKPEKEYRRGSMRKANVIQFQMNNQSLSKSNVNEMSYIILILFKNEFQYEQAHAVLVSLNKIKKPIIASSLIKRKAGLVPYMIDSVRGKACKETIMSTIDEKENETIETNYQMFSKMSKKNKREVSDKPTSTSQFAMKKKPTRNKSGSTIVYSPSNQQVNKDKLRTKSCFDFASLTQRNCIKENPLQIQPQTRPVQAKPITSPDKEILQSKEENMSLCDLLNQMLASSSKKPNVNQSILSQGKAISSTEISSSHSLTHQTKRKKQIDLLINIDNNKSLNDSLFDCGGSIIKQQSIMNIDINSYPNEENNMITLGRKDSEETTEVNRMQSLISKIDNNEVFIYDSFLFKKFRKDNSITHKELGQLFTQSNNSYIKTQLLTEILGLLSKKFLKLSITKSLEIVLKEKEINKNYYVPSSHQHSIEYCIVDVFNSFLGNNQETKELYKRVLPKYIKGLYDIDIALIKNLKNRISLPNLFVIMEYHSQIYFNSNREIDFNEPYPLQSSNIKYISPYLINKLHMKANNILSTITLFHNDDLMDINSSNFLSNSSMTSNSNSKYTHHRHSRNNSHSFISTTNAKRLKNTFAIKPSKQIDQSSLIKLKRYEELNDSTRINLVKQINRLLCEKNYSNALRLCDYYIQKFADIIFLNAFVYLFLAEIYNEINGIEYAKLFIDKTKDLMMWLYPDSNCFFIADCYYTFSLILVKQTDSYITEHRDEINECLDKANELSMKFYKEEDEKRIKIKLQMMIFKLSYIDCNTHDLDNSSIRKDYDVLIRHLDYLHLKKNYNTERVYLDLFIDLYQNLPIRDEAIIRDLLQRIHNAKKNSALE